MSEKFKENTYEEKELENGLRFVCQNSLGEIVGSVTLTRIKEDFYDVGGLYVDPSERGRGISSDLIKMVNIFLDSSRSKGRLINTIRGDAASVYENNGWRKGEYKSDGVYGGYEYTYGE